MVLAGNKIRVQDVTPKYFLKKAATETVTNSSVLQDDDDFVGINFEAGKYYDLELLAHGAGPAAADIKLAWSFTGTLAMTGRSCLGPPTTTADVTATAVMRYAGHNVTTTIGYGTDGTNTTVIHERLRFYVSVAGALTMQWAQNSANATGCTLSAATFLFIQELIPWGT